MIELKDYDCALGGFSAACTDLEDEARLVVCPSRAGLAGRACPPEDDAGPVGMLGVSSRGLYPSGPTSYDS